MRSICIASFQAACNHRGSSCACIRPKCGLLVGRVRMKRVISKKRLVASADLHPSDWF